MELLVRTNLLAVGLNGRAQQLDELPIRLVIAGSALQAIGCIRQDRFDSVLSTWNLEDMPEGLFLRRLRAIKPDLKIIVLVDGKDPSEEILARSIGVCAVLPDDCSDELLVQTVGLVLGLDVPTAVTTEMSQGTYGKNNYRRLISRLRSARR
jgi:DNA-binding NarL/FixJ family response regulator